MPRRSRPTHRWVLAAGLLRDRRDLHSGVRVNALIARGGLAERRRSVARGRELQSCMFSKVLAARRWP